MKVGLEWDGPFCNSLAIQKAGGVGQPVTEVFVTKGVGYGPKASNCGSNYPPKGPVDRVKSDPVSDSINGTDR